MLTSNYEDWTTIDPRFVIQLNRSELDHAYTIGNARHDLALANNTADKAGKTKNPVGDYWSAAAEMAVAKFMGVPIRSITWVYPYINGRLDTRAKSPDVRDVEVRRNAPGVWNSDLRIENKDLANKARVIQTVVRIADGDIRDGLVYLHGWNHAVDVFLRMEQHRDAPLAGGLPGGSIDLPYKYRRPMTEWGQ